MANPHSSGPESWTRLAGIGVEYSAAVGGFTLLGWWVDTRWKTAPWGLLIGAALGIVGATYNLVRISLAAFKGNEYRRHDGDEKPDDDDQS